MMGLEVTGTLGVLLVAKKKGLISSLKEVIDALLAIDFRLSDELIYQVLKKANEKSVFKK